DRVSPEREDRERQDGKKEYRAKEHDRVVKGRGPEKHCPPSSLRSMVAQTRHAFGRDPSPQSSVCLPCAAACAAGREGSRRQLLYSPVPLPGWRNSQGAR